MSVKQISLITMKTGNKVDLPDSLEEGEICFTKDTGEVFIGAPNYEPIQFRTSIGQNGQVPYRNIKLLTEFDTTREITGEYYTQGPLVNVPVPLTEVPYTIYEFDEGVNAIKANISLYDGKNVCAIADIYLCVYGENVVSEIFGLVPSGMAFSGTLNNGKVSLQVTNNTESQYTCYITGKNWTNSEATWGGPKGNGPMPQKSWR